MKLVNAAKISFKDKGSVFIYNRDLVAIAENQVFLKLRPTAPKWLPAWLNGKLVVITLAETSLSTEYADKQ